MMHALVALQARLTPYSTIERTGLVERYLVSGGGSLTGHPMIREQLIEPSQADMQMATNVITAIAHDMGAPRSDVDLALEALGLIPDAS